MSTWTEKLADRLRTALLRGLRRGREGEHMVARAVATAVEANAGKTGIVKGWLTDVVELSSSTAAKCLRMAEAHAVVPDVEVWRALGWDHLRRLLEHVDGDALVGARAEVLAACNEEGVVPQSKRLTDDLIARYGNGSAITKQRRRTSAHNLRVVCDALRALVVAHPNLYAEVDVEARRIADLAEPATVAATVAA